MLLQSWTLKLLKQCENLACIYVLRSSRNVTRSPRLVDQCTFAVKVDYYVQAKATLCSLCMHKRQERSERNRHSAGSSPRRLRGRPPVPPSPGTVPFGTCATNPQVKPRPRNSLVEKAELKSVWARLVSLDIWVHVIA